MRRGWLVVLAALALAGWMAWRGERSAGCLLMSYDRDRDGRRDVAPMAEFVDSAEHLCCRNGGT